MKTKLILGCFIAASAAFGGWKILANKNNAPLTDIQLANAEALASPERSGGLYAICISLTTTQTCYIKCPNCGLKLTSEDDAKGLTDNSTIVGVCPLCGYTF